MQHYTHYFDIIISVYLIGLLLGTMLYAPYRIARRKLETVHFRLTMAYCLFWPITVPVTLLWFMIKCLIILPAKITYGFVVKSFRPSDATTTVETTAASIVAATEHDRETIPSDPDPELIKLLLEDKENDSRTNLPVKLD